MLNVYVFTFMTEQACSGYAFLRPIFNILLAQSTHHELVYMYFVYINFIGQVLNFFSESKPICIPITCMV